jgi:DNA polymerase-3 subunit epsilon
MDARVVALLTRQAVGRLALRRPASRDGEGADGIVERALGSAVRRDNARPVRSAHAGCAPVHCGERQRFLGQAAGGKCLKRVAGAAAVPPLPIRQPTLHIPQTEMEILLVSEPLEDLARQLEQSGDYRVLRRLQPRQQFADRPCERPFVAIALDTETNGLDVKRAEVVELGMVKFSYAPEGDILRVVDVFDQLQAPSAPIPPEVVQLTGITNAMVAGRTIDADAVAAFVDGAALIVAHNAAFDRPLCERPWPIFRQMHWACSMTEVPWRSQGSESAQLGRLLAHQGLFHAGHRAEDDCRALLHLLAAPFGTQGRPAFATLLESARATTIRLYAEGAPFEAKDQLKARAYRWSDGSSGARRAWWKDVPQSEQGSELAWLRANVYHGRPIQLPTRRITARERYSSTLVG